MFRLIHRRMNGLHPPAYQASVADRVAGRRIARIRELLLGDADQLLPDTAHIKPIN
jgi:tRNA(Glu) U13 pseudouridine synthase TruD